MIRPLGMPIESQRHRCEWFRHQDPLPTREATNILPSRWRTWPATGAGRELLRGVLLRIRAERRSPVLSVVQFSLRTDQAPKSRLAQKRPPGWTRRTSIPPALRRYIRMPALLAAILRGPLNHSAAVAMLSLLSAQSSGENPRVFANLLRTQCNADHDQASFGSALGGTVRRDRY